MSAQNTQVTHSAILVEHAPKIVRLQNRLSGILQAAPSWFTDRLAGVYATLGGSGIVNVSDAGLYAPKADGAGATPTAMAYGDQTFRVEFRRHSKVQLDSVKQLELDRKGLNMPADYLSRHTSVAAAVHGYAVGQRLSSTSADRAFPAAATSSNSWNFTGGSPSSLRLALREAEDFFFANGASAAGTKLVCLMNRKVANALAALAEISAQEFIAGVASGGTLVRQGMTRQPRIEAFLREQTTLTVPIEVVVDAQVYRNASGTAVNVLSDDLYFMWVNEDDPGSSFISTPVYDYEGLIEGMSSVDILALTGGQAPIAQVYTGPVFDPPGRFWALEQAFGISVYGEDSRSQVDRVLGYRFSSVLT